MTVAEALDKLTDQLNAKRQQVMDRYLNLLDQDGPAANHARAVLDGRVGQIDLDLINIENVRRLAFTAIVDDKGTGT